MLTNTETNGIVIGIGKAISAHFLMRETWNQNKKHMNVDNLAYTNFLHSFVHFIVDFGTSYSSVGVYRNGDFEFIPNRQGDYKTPSYVAFTKDGQRLVGDPAKSQLATNPTNTIFDFKRMLGRRFDDESVQDDIIYLPFKVINKNGMPAVEVQIKGQLKTFTFEEISAMILKEMKTAAEDHLDESISRAVIAVPASFNDAQRRATVNAGRIAGLEDVHLISAPTAAALDFNLDVETHGQFILVCDLGGGSVDASVLSIEKMFM